MPQSLKVLAILLVSLLVSILGILEIQQSSLPKEIEKAMGKKRVTVIEIPSASAEEITLRSDSVSHIDTLEKKDREARVTTKLFVMKTDDPRIFIWWTEICESRGRCKETRLPYNKMREMHTLYDEYVGR